MNIATGLEMKQLTDIISLHSIKSRENPLILSHQSQDWLDLKDTLIRDKITCGIWVPSLREQLPNKTQLISVERAQQSRRALQSQTENVGQPTG